VQYCINGEQRVFAIRACKGTEAKAAQFSKPKTEQVSTVSTSNKNISASVRALLP
jgi:hypothetical protein